MRSIAAAGRPAIAASRRSGSRRTCGTRPNSTWSRCGRRRTIPRSAATITACRGRAGARPQFKHPGSPILYNTNLPVKDGGGTFRARFGVERVVKRKVTENGQEVEKEARQSPGRRVLLRRLGDQGRLSRVHPRRAQEARLGQGSHAGGNGDHPKVTAANPDAVSWSTDLSGGIQRVAIEHGCAPMATARRAAIAWNLPDPVPVAPRADLHAASRSRREISDPAGRRAVPRTEYRLHGAEGGRR